MRIARDELMEEVGQAPSFRTDCELLCSTSETSTYIHARTTKKQKRVHTYQQRTLVVAYPFDFVIIVVADIQTLTV